MSEKYSATIEDLYDLQKFSIKMGLDNIRLLCKHLGNPQRNYRIIHIAGTNGKGSTATMIHTILTNHGLKVGLYTSPHLVDFRERIRVNDQLIDKTFIVDYWQNINLRVHQLKATFFDTTTALAFDYFHQVGVDIAIIETGLGGRLDSTNIVHPDAVVLTPIAIDHIKQLGRKLKSVAMEKASIIKNNASVFSAKQKKIVKEVLSDYLTQTNPYTELSRGLAFRKITMSLSGSQFGLLDKIRNCMIEDIELCLAGHFQIENAGLSYLVSRWLIEKINMRFSPTHFRRAMATIQWPGRLQSVSKEPFIYFDVSHNYAGIKETVNFINKYSEHKSRLLLIGLLDDKEYKPIVRLLSKYFSRIFITEPKHERAFPVKVLQSQFLRFGIKCAAISDGKKAYQVVCKHLKKSDLLLVIGSHFLIGQLLKR